MAVLLAFSLQPAFAQEPRLFAAPRAEIAAEDPAAVAIGADGLVYTAERGRDRVLVLTPDGRVVATIGSRGTRPGELLAPGGLAVHTAEDVTALFVADTGNHRVQVWTRAAGAAPDAWELSDAFATFPTNDVEMLEPRGIAVDSSRVYVVDTGNDRLLVLDHAGRLLLRIGERGSEPGSFHRPLDVAVGPDGALYLSDADRSRIQKLSRDGEVVATWGQWGSHAGQLGTPAGLAFHHGHMYVADVENHRIALFEPDGDWAGFWGIHAVRPREGGGKLHYPDGIAIAPDGSFAVVAESFEGRLQVFGAGPAPEGLDPLDPANLPGTSVPHFGERLDADGPWLTLTEPESHRVLVFDALRPEPIRVTVLGRHGTKPGLFLRPTDTHVDASTNTVLVTDAGNDRLQEFRLEPLEEEPGFDPALAKLVRALDLRDLATNRIDPPLPRPIDAVAVERDREGNVYLLDGRNALVIVLGPDWRPRDVFGGRGTDAGKLLRPTDLALDLEAPDGQVLHVVDSLAARILTFDLEGRPLAAWGERSLVRPFGVAVTSAGETWVSDEAKDTLAVFDREGKLLREQGSRGLGPAQLYRPKGIVEDGMGRLIAIDFGNHRGMIYAPDGELLNAFGARLFVRPAREGLRPSGSIRE